VGKISVLLPMSVLPSLFDESIDFRSLTNE